MDWRLLQRGLASRAFGRALGTKAALAAVAVLLLGAAAPFGSPRIHGSSLLAVPADTFPHARHAKIACLECHELGSGHGRLRFERPAGCAACHHQQSNQARCTSCHVTEKYAAAKHMTVTVTVAGHPPKPRPVDFLHARHSARPCAECHTTPGTLAPAPSKAQCQDCHSEHHAVGRTCSACHTLADPKVAHKTLDIAHQRCDACHTATTVARLMPTRSLCSTCHTAKARNHYDQKECTVCHFMADPEVYRAKLSTPSTR